jgi:hypothetical protein
MAGSAGDSPADKYLGDALRRFCRSIELCDDYLRGYYGLSLVRTPATAYNEKFNFFLTNSRLPVSCYLYYHKHPDSQNQTPGWHSQISRPSSV